MHSPLAPENLLKLFEHSEAGKVNICPKPNDGLLGYTRRYSLTHLPLHGAERTAQVYGHFIILQLTLDIGIVIGLVFYKGDRVSFLNGIA